MSPTVTPYPRDADEQLKALVRDIDLIERHLGKIADALEIMCETIKVKQF